MSDLDRMFALYPWRTLLWLWAPFIDRDLKRKLTRQHRMVHAKPGDIII